MKTFGSRVKQRRLQLGLTQEDLAKKVGLSGRSTVNKWEKDQNGITQDKIVILANALDVSPDYFFIDDESPVVNEATFPISFGSFTKSCEKHGISEKDLDSLSDNEKSKLFDLIKQYVETFKKD